MTNEKADIIQTHIEQLYQETDFIVAVFDEFMGFAVIAADFDGNILAFNKDAERIYGYPQRDVVGKLEYAALFPQMFSGSGDLPRLIETLMREGHAQFTTDNMRSGGESFLAHGAMNLIHNKNGEVKGFVAIVEDISASKLELERLTAYARKSSRITGQIYGEQSLKESNPELFQKLLNQYLNLLETAIEQEFYRVAHSIREPLHELAETLGFLGATPHDVVELHTDSIKAGMDRAHNWPDRAYVEVGRMVILQVMGFLVTYYRNRSHSGKKSGDPNHFEKENK